MRRAMLMPGVGEVALESLTTTGSGVVMLLRASRTEVCCPGCGTRSRRVHSRYLRTLSDLPWEGVAVAIRLRTRRFFCTEARCTKRIFTEPLPATVSRYGRRTCRSHEALDGIAMALGGAAGSRLARQLGLLADRSTLLRLLRRRGTGPAPATPRVLGIDDWAWRKGRRYGTILCDLERGTVIDLLPNRERSTVERWLGAHPGVEILSRDRDAEYAQAAHRAAPQATQVADRWHLLRSCSDALKASLPPYYGLLKQLADDRVPPSPPSVPEVPRLTGPLSPAKIEAKRQNRERRYARYLEVMERVMQGRSDGQIARELGMDRSTVVRWRQTGAYPERQDVPRPRQADDFSDYLQQRWDEGCRSGTALWVELRQRGFRGGKELVRIWIRRRYGLPLNRPRTPHLRPLPLRATARRWMWLLLNDSVRGRKMLAELHEQAPELAANAEAAQEFFRIIRERDLSAWPRWLEQARHTSLAGFATHLQRDEAAVLAALQLPWSNGPVEGHVHRLKLIKRQMYGRARFDLLRLRVLHTR